jgi:hypothetical protein
VVRIDPARLAIIARYQVGGRSRQLAVGAGSVWVANEGSDTVSRIMIR